jgi:hypothetical protein
MAGITAIQRLSIYADDVILFFRPEIQELQAIKEIITIFGEATGLKVNYSKTTTTLIKGGEELEQSIKDNLGCQIAYFPLNYLGLRLALRPLTRSEWQPALDMMIRTMPAWQRGLIDRVGRLTLIKAAIMAKPIHQLLIAEAPVWLLEEIVKWARAFFWAGKQGVSGGQCLVAWDSVYRPWSQGGLGIKNLQLQGLALRSRWEWLRRTDPERPWQGLPMLKDQSARAVFDTLTVITIGDGKQVMFWTDRWINGLTATDIAPMVVLGRETGEEWRTPLRGMFGWGM